MEITELEFETQTASREYPKDNGPNPFGYYTHLEMVQTRQKKNSAAMSSPSWRLVNKQTGLVQKLSLKEVRECLHVLFVTGACIEYK